MDNINFLDKAYPKVCIKGQEEKIICKMRAEACHNNDKLRLAYNGWRLNTSLGKVRPEIVKKVARELVERFPNKFTTNFEDNKKVLSSVAPLNSVKLRNRIAGYITRLVAISQASETETEQAEKTEEIEGAEEVTGETETEKEKET